MSWVFEFAEHIVFGSFSIVFLLLFLRQRMRTQRALREPVSHDVCVACDSKQITTVASEVFRCDSCGFTWGDGIKQLKAVQRRTNLEGMSPTERRAQAVVQLQEARDLLGGALAALEQGSHQLGWDVMIGDGKWIDGTGDFRSETREAMIRSAVGDIHTAQQCCQHAHEALGKSVDNVAAPSANSDIAALDVLAGSIVADLMAHQQLGQLRDHAQTMLKGIEQALQKLQPDHARQ